METSSGVSNSIIVLAAFDPPATIGGISAPRTATFAPDNGGTFGIVNVELPTAQPTPSATTSAPLTQAGVETVAVTPDQPFSLPLQNLPSGGAAAPVDVAVRQVDGLALPSWVHFDAATGTLSGIAPENGPRVLRLVVVERDSSGHVTRREVIIDLGSHRANQANAHGPAHPPTPATPPAPHAALAPAAKPSLTAQIARLRRELHVA